MLPDALYACFAAAVRWLRKIVKSASGDSRNCQGAAAKREWQSIRSGPQLLRLPYLVEWAKARRFPPGQNPRNRRCERSGRSPECRRPSLFLLHHQKAHSLFPRKKRMGVLKLPGFPGTPVLTGKRFSPAAEPQSLRPSPHHPAPGTGAHPVPRKGNPPSPPQGVPCQFIPLLAPPPAGAGTPWPPGRCRTARPAPPTTGTLPE